MSNIHFDSPITGISSFSNHFVAGTEEGIYYIMNSNNCQIEMQFSLPSLTGIPSPPMWSSDGDFIWCFLDNTTYFFKPVPTAKIESFTLPAPIVRLFPHTDGISAVALLANNTICQIKPTTEQSLSFYGPFSDEERVISIVRYDRKLAVIIESENPQIQFIDTTTLEMTNTIYLEKRTSNMFFAVSSSFGIVVFWADGHWEKFLDSLSSVGTCASAIDISINGSHLCTSSPDGIHIYDLKFDAELQHLNVHSNGSILFNNTIASFYENEVRVTPWKGLKVTTSRALIGSATPTTCEEVNIELEYDPTLAQPTTNEVTQSEPRFSYKSIANVINSIMENKFVPQHIIDQAIEQLKDPIYDDIRSLAMFHLSPSIPIEEIAKAINEKRLSDALILMKKIQISTPEEVSGFIRLMMSILEENEIILAHFIMKPIDPTILRNSLKLLNSDEVDMLLHFLAKLMSSRRRWKDLNASLAAIDSITKWSSILITEHLVNLKLNNKTEGLQNLQMEMKEEAERIEAAGNCWSIFETLTEKKHNFPPSFLYLVEKLQIPE
ncbi:hypothetical protein GPJ56_004688 [Histomonas meleagridis]|uniref:uncharacterized protein n=1 Tax=Histomonas meleagridis TaxID=135588 RepID=UPI0035595816|nr:hypothetical protein GPJ56_004688 [Histomonas meleagridis]KAH0797449.1 hypothetical protein GO595_009770 [Histomonas meleagridis]